MACLTIDLEHHEPQETRSRQIRITVFVHAEAGQISVSTDAEAPFLSLAYYPNIEPEAKLPPPELDAVTEMGGVRFTAHQHFPATAPSEQNPNPSNSDLDRSFFLCGRLLGEWTVQELAESQRQLKEMASAAPDTYTRYAQRPRVFCRSARKQPFRLDLALATTRDARDNRNFAMKEVQTIFSVANLADSDGVGEELESLLVEVGDFSAG